MEYNIDGLFGSFSGLGEVMTSFALFANAPWPEFTLPDFHEHAAHVIDATPVEVIWTAPIVPTEERVNWESYSVQQSTSFVSPRIFEIVDGVFTPEPATGPGPYLPIWQQAPVATSLVNFDQYSDPFFVANFDAVVAINQAMISPVSPVDDLLAKSGLQDEEDEGKPHSTFIQPVYDSFGDGKQIVSYLQARRGGPRCCSQEYMQPDLHMVSRWRACCFSGPGRLAPGAI
jgi:hypothetical protein